MTRVLFACFFAFILIACQAAPATSTVITPTETVPPSAIPTDTETTVPTATQAIVLTPTISPEVLKEAASPLCETAFSALVESGPFTPPFSVMKKEIYADAPAWDFAHQLPHLGSLSESDVQTLFCISESRTQTRTYTDGSAAYQFSWDVRAVSVAEERVIGRNSFAGSPPSETKILSSGVGEGSFPYGDFAAWIFNQIEHPDFIFFDDSITSIAISSDGRRAAFGTAVANQVVDRDYQAKIFLFNPSDLQTDLRTSAFLNVLNGHQGMVTSLAFSPDGKILASSGYDFFIKFWDVGTGSLLGQVSMGEDTPNILAFSPDGSKLAVASNLQITFIDPTSMQITVSLPEASAADLTVSPDGSLLYVRSSGGVKIIDPDAARVTLTFPDPSTLIPTLAVGANGNVESVTYAIPDSLDGFTLSPDGTQVITYTIDRSVESDSGVENVRLAAWDARTGKYLRETKFAGDSVGAISFSPDGRLLAIGNNDTIWLWETESWQITNRFSGHNDLIEDLVFTPDGKSILSAARDGTIRVWSLEE